MFGRTQHAESILSRRCFYQLLLIGVVVEDLGFDMGSKRRSIRTDPLHQADGIPMQIIID